MYVSIPERVLEALKLLEYFGRDRSQSGRVSIPERVLEALKHNFIYKDLRRKICFNP